MQHIITPYYGKASDWMWWDNAFSNEELDVLQDAAKSSTTTAVIGSSSDVEEVRKFRRTLINWVNKSPDSEWIYNKLSDIVSNVNSSNFHFDLSGFGEPLQLTHYDSADQGTYDWHVDKGGLISRKLSLVVQLSHPYEYEGGDLELLYSKTTHAVPKKRGYIAIFPSWVLHRVTPVTKGTRQSLVVWISGPPFR